MIQRSREHLTAEGMPPPEMLNSVLSEHIEGLPRLRMLHRYYEGKNDILERQRAVGLPNNRVAHAFARYIVTVTAGYLIGQPAAYRMNGGKSETLDRISETFERGSVSSVDMENAHNAAIYGRAIEYVHVDDAQREGSNEENVIPHVTALSPEDAFVVYDNTYDMRPLFGVYYIQQTKADGTADGFRIWVMSDRLTVQYRAPDLGSMVFAQDGPAVPHFFGGVPLVEYWNGSDERGDFEWVIPQIDAYDKLASDRINDKEQYVDKLLVLYGCTLEVDEQGRTPGQQLRQEKCLSLPDPQSKAEYLGSAMDETNVEVQRQALAEDIRKLSLVPDLTDREFAANASGVAMRYKLYGLDQLTKSKERWFIEGLRSRLALYARFMQVKGMPALDVADVSITLSRAMPANRLEQAQIANTAKAAGAASVSTLVNILHDGEGWKEEQVSDEVAQILQEEGDPLGQFGNLIPGDNRGQLEEQGDVMRDGDAE